MTKIYLLTNLVLVSGIIVICAISQCNGVISDKRLCYDPDCKEPVALARTVIRYNSIEPYVLSFLPNIEIKIFSKEAGSRLDLWGAEVTGKRGYVPKRFVREYKKLKSNLTYEVPTEFFEKQVTIDDKVKINDPNQPASSKDNEKDNVDKQVDNTQNVKIEDPNRSKTLPNSGKNEELNKTVDLPQASKDFENVTDKVDLEENTKNEIVKTEESEGSEKADNSVPETKSVDPPVTESVDSQPKEFLDEKKAEKFLDGVQNVIPSYQVIDGTTIPLAAEEVPIKPSYPTPAIEATVIPDEGPILSVHPNIPVTGRPLIASFLNVDSRIAEGHIKQDTNVLTENQSSETGSFEKFSPEQDKAEDSPVVKENVVEKPVLDNESKTETSQDQSIDGNTKFLETIVPAENNDKKSKLESPEDSVETSVDTNSGKEELSPRDEATVSSANDDVKDEVGTIENNLKNLNESSNEDLSSEINESSDEVEDNESKKDIPEVESGDKENHKEEMVSKTSPPEIAQSKNELDGSISEEKFQDSREQTEHLSDEKVINDTKETDGPNSVGEAVTIPETEITGSEKPVAQNEDKVILNDTITEEHNDNFTVHNVDDIGVKTLVEDDSQSNSASEETKENDNLNLSSEEAFTEAYSNVEEEKATISRNLLTFQDGPQFDDNKSDSDALDLNESDRSEAQFSHEYGIKEPVEPDTVDQITEGVRYTEELTIQVTQPEVCDINSDCADLDNGGKLSNEDQETIEDEEESFYSGFEQHNYLETLLFVSVTAFTTLLFSLGYYYIEDQRRDKELVAKINVLEKDLLVTTKESMMLSESLKAAKTKLDSIEDESFGSNEMVLSLKAELEAAQVTKGELEDQIITLEKELESASEAGLELERMLREFLSSQSDENPLAQSVEDLQTRLNAQQATNESLTNSLNLKSQENEALTAELAVTQEKCQGLEVEVTRLAGDLQVLNKQKNSLENDYSAKITQLNKQISKLSGDRADLINQLRTKEVALNDLAEVIQKQNIEGLDFEKIYDVSHIKAEAQLVAEERDELKNRLTEVEGAHQLLEEHMKLIKEEISSVTKQYELAERDKTEAQTRLEVLSNYFKEKESQLQKELGMQEALWVQKQGEVTSTVDRIQTMQNEIQNYRQQIETLKREILDQEREYKSQIAALETKSHEQWVIARQSERRLEESKAEASQLRNRLTMVEKNMNEVDPDSKLHRLETNGETASSPQLFMGAESSSSPIIFTGSSGVPPLPPSYLFGAPLPPPFIPPPPHSGNGPMYDISRRPPPLGGRLSSPPPMPLHHPPGRYEDTISPPPPLSPPLHPPYNSFRSPPPPLPPFGNEHIHPHPPPPFLPPVGTPHSWGDEPLPPLRNPVFHPHQREQRLRNHKGSLHSSGDSLDKSNHTGKT